MVSSKLARRYVRARGPVVAEVLETRTGKCTDSSDGSEHSPLGRQGDRQLPARYCDGVGGRSAHLVADSHRANRIVLRLQVIRATTGAHFTTYSATPPSILATRQKNYKRLFAWSLYHPKDESSYLVDILFKLPG